MNATRVTKDGAPTDDLLPSATLAMLSDVVDRIQPADETDSSDTDGDGGRIDGRHLRRSRNRDAVLDSLLELLREGNLDPTVPQVAQRAGVSHRSVFRYFDDVADLLCNAFSQEIGRVAPMAQLEHPGEGTFAERVDAIVAVRLRLYAEVRNILWTSRTKAPAVPELSERLALMHQVLRGQIHRQFAWELDGLPEDERDARLDALQALLSFDTYDTNVRVVGATDDRVAAMWRAGLVALLPPST